MKSPLVPLIFPCLHLHIYVYIRLYFKILKNNVTVVFSSGFTRLQREAMFQTGAVPITETITVNDLSLWYHSL